MNVSISFHAQALGINSPDSMYGSCMRWQVQEELFDKLNGSAEGRIRIWFGLRQILNATDPLLLGTKAAADKHKTGIHMVSTLRLYPIILMGDFN